MTNDDFTNKEDKYLDFNYEYYYLMYNDLVKEFIEAYGENNYDKIEVNVKKSLQFLDEKEQTLSKIGELDYFTKFSNKLISDLPLGDNIEEENKKDIIETFYNLTKEIFHFGSCYSLFYSLNNFSEKLQQYIIFPEHVKTCPNQTKSILIEILTNKHITKEDIPNVHLDFLTEYDFCNINDEDRIIVSLKGINLLKTFNEIEKIVLPQVVNSDADVAWDHIRDLELVI